MAFDIFDYHGLIMEVLSILDGLLRMVSNNWRGLLFITSGAL